MPASVAVIIDPPRIQVRPDEKASATVTIRNRSEEVAHYLLSVEGLSNDWAEFAPNQVSAFPLQETRSVVTVHPPQGTTGATYHLTVHAVSLENAALQGQALLDVDVPAVTQPVVTPQPVVTTVPDAAPKSQYAEQIQISAEPLAGSKLPPPAMQWRLTLRNMSNVLDTYSFNITGIRPNWVNIEPTALTLKPDQEGTAILTVRPGDDTPGGTIPFKLRTFSHLNLSQRTELALQIQVKQNAGFKLGLSPREAESQGMREFQVTLTSDALSNTDLWVNLVAADQDNACDYTFQPPQVFLPAKQTVTSTLRVMPRAVLGPNERKTYTFKVVATSRDGQSSPQEDEARLTQTGAVPLAIECKPLIASGEMSADYEVTVTNPSAVETYVILSGQDPEEACDYIFRPSKLTVAPKSQVQVALRVKARTSLNGEGRKELPFTIAATRLGELVPAVKLDANFVQLQLKPISLVLIPSQQSQPGRARYFVQVKNPRSTPIRIWLDAKDDEDAVAFSLQPTEIQLSSGADGMSTLTARPKDKLLPDQQRRVHKFTVTGNVDGSEAALTTKGTLAQIRGTDWGVISGSAVRWGLTALKWLIVLSVVIFVATVSLAGIDRIAQRSPELARLVYAVLSPTLIRGLLNISPFAGPAQGIVYLIEGIINASQPR